ncbi:MULTISPECIES: chalcone isomerase family protein [unclassified Agarivorans]|uniref:chalcone isomerase family protein n=1 Tax=unclassified Agarivorans TaxID=2636026 RepID=UPI0026E43993|nr:MULTISPECIES: chalcone isomerase family protein [unclassified Agarivorans]MDO6684162.1 chalcone isomerase family protein [Agarivorans sp. 3_MG-2023]MDO6714104.1 chalcone isomerase family protein [Agarivorans sp. 2_MG-2023]
MFKTLFIAIALFSSFSQASNMKLVGDAKLKVLFWSIYNVSLHSPDGQYQQHRYPMVLTIDYLRKINRSKLVGATKDEWQRLGVCEQSPCQQWLNKLSSIWPDLKKGDQLQLVADSANQGRFYLNGEHLGSLDDNLFSQHFLDIWLSENSRFPKQQRSLTGAN